MPKKIDNSIQVDMLTSLDLSDWGLGKNEWDFDASKPDDVAQVAKDKAELLQRAEGRQRTVAAIQSPDVKTLSELFKLFCADKRTSKQWKDPDAAEQYDYGPHIIEFIEIVGDKPIVMMTADDARKYRAAVLDKKPEAIGNKVKRLNRVKAFLNWARKQQHTTIDFSGIFTLESVGKVNRSYEPFTIDELKKLFHSFQYQKAEFAKASQYWIPLIGLYTGSRINEIAQLYVKDIAKVDGIDAIDINDDDVKTTKNTASKRTVPIHPQLRQAGFFDYVELIRSEGYERLFPCEFAGT